MSNHYGTITGNGDIDLPGWAPGEKVAIQLYGDAADFDSASVQVQQQRPDAPLSTPDFRDTGDPMTAAVDGITFYYTGTSEETNGEPGLIRINVTGVATGANIGYRVVSVEG